MRRAAGFAIGWPLLAVALTAGCFRGTTPGTRDVRITPRDADGSQAGRKINQFQMQEYVRRFTSKFISAVASATEPLTEAAPSAQLRQAALGRLLIYSSSALDIASGPLPEVNVLDMVVFVSLSRSSIERYWMPQVFGEQAAPLLAAFRTSEQQAWDLSAKILTAEQQSELSYLIRSWLEANPDNIRVELVRFKEFSELAGTVMADQRRRARGLLGSVAAATQAADHALLLSERAVFLANRMPFLLRIQTRLGATEMLGDSVDRIGAELRGDLPDPRLLMNELLVLTTESRRTLEELRLLSESLKPLLESGKLQRTIDDTARLTAEARALLRELEALEPERAKEAVLALETRARHFTTTLLVKLGLLGAAWIVLFWTGYYLVKGPRGSNRATPNGRRRHPPAEQRTPSHS